MLLRGDRAHSEPSNGGFGVKIGPFLTPELLATDIHIQILIFLTRELSEPLMTCVTMLHCVTFREVQKVLWSK